MKYENLAETIKVAKGEEPAEFVLKNAEIVNVYTGSFEVADIAIHKGIIAGVGKYKGIYERDIQRSIVVPGFIDAHMHIESSMLCPEELSVELIKHGTTTVIVDPHEIANISGLTGIDYLLNATRDVPVDFFFMAPSSVPSVPSQIETTGAYICDEEILMLLANPAMLGLGEVMDILGVLNTKPTTIDKILIASKDIIDGHAPKLKEKLLNAYIVAGPTSDHETTTLNEAIEKLSRGMFLMIREGTVAKNLDALIPAVNYLTSRNMAMVTDDRSLVDIKEQGHLDYLLRKAISKGIDIRLAIQMITLNPAQHYGLNDRGAISPGKIADLLVLSDITSVFVKTVIKNGIITFDIGQDLQFAERFEPPMTLKNSIFTDYVNQDHFKIKVAGEKARIIKIIPGEIITQTFQTATYVVNNEVQPDISSDILKIAVVNRYSHDVKLSVGLINGFNLKSGALASSISHDAHNIVVVGTNDADMATAVNHIIKNQGGLVVAKDKRILEFLPLTIAGLISDQNSERVYSRFKALNKAAQYLGTKLHDPFMTLSFMTLATVPSLKITDKGLVDVDRGELVSLFV